MLQIVLIRHGETDWNKGRRIMGHQAIPLNETGQEQIHRLREHLLSVPFDTIFTSPMARASESAELLRGSREIPIIEEPALAEINYGSWVGKTFDEVKAHPEFDNYYRRPSEVEIPEGETFKDVVSRVQDFIEGLRAEGRSRVVAAVSHADVIKVALMQCLALPLDEIHRIRIDNGSYSVLWLDEKFERALIVNSLPSLDGFFDKESLFARKK